MQTVLAVITLLLALASAARHVGVWDSPPTGVPSTKVAEGPLLGNGDMGVVLGGSRASLDFFIGLNQFWAIETVTVQEPQEPNYPRVVSVGGIRLDVPSFNNKYGYRAEQDVDEARVSQ